MSPRQPCGVSQGEEPHAPSCSKAAAPKQLLQGGQASSTEPWRSSQAWPGLSAIYRSL